MNTTHTKLAPVQLIAAAFDNLQFEGSSWSALSDLERLGLIRILDAAAIARTIDDDIVGIDVSDLPIGSTAASGRLIRQLLGVDESLPLTTQEFALGQAMLVESEFEYGMTPEELQTILEDIPRRGGMIAILIEHVWALPLKLAVSQSGGFLLAQDFLNPEALVTISSQLLGRRP